MRAETWNLLTRDRDDRESVHESMGKTQDNQHLICIMVNYT